MFQKICCGHFVSTFSPNYRQPPNSSLSRFPRLACSDRELLLASSPTRPMWEIWEVQNSGVVNRQKGVPRKTFKRISIGGKKKKFRIKAMGSKSVHAAPRHSDIFVWVFALHYTVCSAPTGRWSDPGVRAAASGEGGSPHRCAPKNYYIHTRTCCS